MTLDELLRAARGRLAAAGVDGAPLDARLLVGEALGLDAAAMIARGDEAVAEALAVRALDLVERRAGGEPVGRILGRRAFHGIDLLLGPDTLEPRPDTETLVEHAIALVSSGALPGAGAGGTGLLIADIGTGTGAIALSLLAALPGARAIATDVSPGALEVARENAARTGLSGRVDFRLGHYLEPITERCGLVVSNPPYIETAEIGGLAVEVREHDPLLALDGGPDGLVAYRVLAAGARARLVAGGTMAVEIGSRQASAVAGLFRAAGFADIEVLQDLAGLDRVVSART